MTAAAYIAARVLDCGGCQRWTGTVCNGHPAGSWDGKRCILIRRVVWEQANGPIPPGKIIRCTCETPLCVELEHLTLTTYRKVALDVSRHGLMGGPVRAARIAATKRAGTQARISQDDARAIRASEDTGKALAARYGIAEATVSKIKLGKIRREFVGNVWAGLAERTKSLSAPAATRGRGR